MALFRIMGKLSLDSSEFTAGLKKAESGATASLAAIGSRVAAAFSVAAVTAFVTSVAKAAGEIGDLADQLQITTAEVQALQKAADHSGVSFDKYAAALSKIRKLKADFAAGDAGAIKTFQKTGLNPNAGDMSLLQSVGGLPDAQAFEILDAKSARLKNSIAAIKALTPIELIDDNTIQKLDAAGDRLGDMWRVIKAMTAKGTVTTIDAGRGLGITIDEVLSSFFGIRSAMDQRNNGRALPLPNGPKGIATHQEFLTRTGMPEGFTMNGRSSELVGPMPKMPGQFSRIDLGDRANVGGFFGPNADLNRSMQRTLASMDQSLKTIEKSVSTTMNTQ